MTYPQAMTAELLDKDGAVNAADLSDAFGLEFFDESNGCGSGSMSLPYADAAASLLVPGRFVRIKIDGVARFTFKIEGNPRFATIQQGGLSEQIVTVQGRGWACIFDEAILYPTAPLGARLDHSWVLYSFAHPDFPNAGGWPVAVELYEFLDGVAEGLRFQLAPDGNLYPSPINFPWPVSPNNYDTANPPGAGYTPTYWIWSEAGYPNEEYQLGWCFFRKTFTLGADTLVTFAVTADNFFTLFVDGVPILGENADHTIWQGWKEVPVALSAGTYTIAAVVENVGFPGQTGALTTNPAGFIMTVHEKDGNQAPANVKVVTDNTWTCEFVSNVARWPGWTPGQVIAHMITEAQTRDVTYGLALYAGDTFSDTLDSDGNAWRPVLTTVNSDQMSIAFDTGSTILEALGKLHQDGWINWSVQPGTLTLDVVRGREPTPASSATFTEGVNIRDLERAETDRYANALLVQWEEGFVVVEDSAAITAHGTRVEDLWDSQAPSEQEAEDAGESELVRRAQEGLPAIVMGIEPTGAGDAPYQAFTKLDYVTIPAVGGGTEVVRVLSIQASQDNEGFVQWGLEMNRKLRIPEVERVELLRQIGGRSQIVRGRVQ